MKGKFNPRKTKYLKIVNKLLSLVYTKPKSNYIMMPEQVKNICIIDFTAIGDIVMLTSFLRILKANYKNSTITLVCEPWAQDILYNQQLVDNFIIYDGSKQLENPKSIMKNMRNIKNIIKIINCIEYDISLEPRGDLRYLYFLHLINAKRKISYNYTGGEYWLTDAITPSNLVNHLVEDKLYLLEQIGCKFSDEDKYPRLNLTQSDLIENQKFISDNAINKDHLITGMHPGSRAMNKQWLGFGELLEKLYMEDDKQVFLIFEGPGEKDAVDILKMHAEKVNARIIIVKENIRNYIRIMAICNRVICNDSGAGHIAAAYNIPVTVVFGYTLPDGCKPYSNQTVNIISHNVNCKPCMSSICINGSQKCLEDVKVDEVLEYLM